MPDDEANIIADKRAELRKIELIDDLSLIRAFCCVVSYAVDGARKRWAVSGLEV